MADPKPLHELPGYKRVPVTIVLHIYETIQDNWDDAGRFFIEENHCLDNYIMAIAETKDRHEHPTRPVGYCVTCSRGEAFLGHVPFEAIRAAQPAPGTANPYATDMEIDLSDPWAGERQGKSNE